MPAKTLPSGGGDTLNQGGTFRALRHRNYRVWFIGQTVSLIGTWMQTMAQQVLVYRLTDSAAALGIVSFVGLIPVIPLSFWAGSIADRFPKQKVILLAQMGMMAQALILAALTLMEVVQIWHVYLLSFLFGALTAIDLPARQAFTVDLVAGKEDLTNAIGLNSTMFNTARALGPALAGMVVAATGEAIAFFLNAATFLAVIASLLMMRNLPDSSRPLDKNTGTFAHMVEGMRFIVSQRAVSVLISLVAVSAFLSMPFNTLMPVFGGEVLTSSAKPIVEWFCGAERGLMRCQSPEALPLGILLTTVGIGAVIAALTVASLPSSARRGRWLTFGSLAFPALLLAFAFSRSFLVSVAIMLGVGFCFVIQNALANTLLQIASPDELRGRVMSFYTMTFQVTMRLGGLQAGLVADWSSAPFSIGIGAVVSLVYGLFVTLRFQGVRELK
ncbi:MAG: MFS transporter [Bellilinea sp.]|jgi:MFS family permease